MQRAPDAHGALDDLAVGQIAILPQLWARWPALADFLPGHTEGLVAAEIDLGAIALAKALADPVGHYARPDVLRLVHDPSCRREIAPSGEPISCEAPAEAADASASLGDPPS